MAYRVERFFFAGGNEVSALKFEQIAVEQNWHVLRGNPFWQLSSGNDEGRAVRYLMKLYRSGRTRVTSRV